MVRVTTFVSMLSGSGPPRTPMSSASITGGALVSVLKKFCAPFPGYYLYYRSGGARRVRYGLWSSTFGAGSRAASAIASAVFDVVPLCDARNGRCAVDGLAYWLSAFRRSISACPRRMEHQSL
jgi:hypothetical protein